MTVRQRRLVAANKLQHGAGEVRLIVRTDTVGRPRNRDPFNGPATGLEKRRSL
jgi:hypothetical protein